MNTKPWSLWILVALLVCLVPQTAARAEDAPAPAEELDALLAELRQLRASYYERQRARDAGIERARTPVHGLEVEIAELKAREEEADKELAQIREETDALRRDEAASHAAEAAAAPLLEQAVAHARALLDVGIPYRKEDRAARLGPANANEGDEAVADEPPLSDRFGRYWLHVQEELRLARSGEAFTAEVDLDEGRTKAARHFRVGHLVLGYLSEDGRDAGLWTGKGWTAAETPDELGRIQAAIEMLDRRRAPALLPLPVREESGR